MRAIAAALAGLLSLTLLPAPAIAADTVIATAGLRFVPPDITVAQGDGLLHVNPDAFDHDVTSEQNGPDGQPLFAGATLATGGNTRVQGVERLAPGTYPFFCSVHRTTMKGTLTVAAAPVQASPVALAPVPGAFQLPVALAQHPASGDLYIVEKVGRIRAVRDGLLFDPTPVLDVTNEVSSGLEQGLLGLAFSPDGKFIYVNLTDTAGDTRIVEYAFANGVANEGSRRELLKLDQPFTNHNGGTLTFGPDGYLYIALGDGGSGGDPGYRAQSLNTLLGKVLRIDPRPSGGAAYTVPANNPFVPDPNKPPPPAGALTEIWSYGLRNPWKFSFDRATGDLWIADVGQDAWEEINLARAGSAGGENYGWNHMEGLTLYPGRPAGAVEPANHARPLFAYARTSPKCAVTGGFVYRGSAIPSLKGAYLFSDWCEGQLRYIREEGGQVVQEADLSLNVPSITSFGEDHDGELYAISLGGAIFKIVPVVPAQAGTTGPRVGALR